jgi:hypothetical protein
MFYALALQILVFSVQSDDLNTIICDYNDQVYTFSGTSEITDNLTISAYKNTILIKIDGFTQEFTDKASLYYSGYLLTCSIKL